MNRTLSIWLLSLMALAGSAGAESLDLTRTRLPGGGGPSAGGQFTLFSTVGQAEAGPKLSGGAYALDTAFLSAAMDNSLPTIVFAQGVVTVTEDAGAQSRTTFTTFLPGQAGEPAQPPTYQLANNNSALFSVAPAIATDRTLSFTSALNASGSATVTVVARLSGVDVATNTFSIVVLPVNDAPVVTLTGNVTVLEDAGAQSVAAFATFTAGPPDESTQTPAYTLTTDNAALFAVAPAIAVDGTLTFTAAANANGSATVTVVTSDGGGTANGGVDRTTNTFTLAVTAVNDPPAATYAMSTVVVLEDAGPQSLASFAAFTPGPADESAQTASYSLAVDNAALFSTAPAIAPNGTLSFTPAANANGSATVTVIVADNGGTANGGVDRSTNTFAITVTAVNDAPTAVFASNNFGVLEDMGPVTFASFATFTAGPPDEAMQTASYVLAANNAALFSAQPAIAPNGTLTFTPAANANGVATVTVIVADNGGTANGGVDRSTNSFTITVTPVNDPPVVSFALGTVTVLEDVGAQSLAGFATFSAGPADETASPAQTLVGYTVSNNNPALFTTAPALALNGTLTFTPAANANGSATITVIAQDSGGTANGGVDKTTNTFTVSVTAVNDAPAVAFATNHVVAQKDAGAQTLAGFALFTAGPVDEAGQTAAYTVTTDNPGLFSSAPALAPDGTLTFAGAPATEGMATVTVVVQDNGGTANGGVDKATNTFNLTVLPFAATDDAYTVVEDGTLVIPVGSGVLANDIGNTIRAVLVTTTVHGVLVLNTNGSFTYQPAADFNGSDTFTYQATNSANTSAVTTVTLTVKPVNDAPTVTFAQGTVTVLEDAGAQTVSAFAVFSPGPMNESAQTLVGYSVSVDNASLFTTPPAIDNAGVLTFTSAPDANGSATVTVIVQDNGGTTDGGVDKSTNTFVITVTPVNDAPAFTLAQNAVTVLEDAGTQTVNAFATFSAGPANESAQTLVGYAVSVNNASLFSSAPAINNAGVLTFTPAANANGSATVTVVAQDSGGTAGGGVDKATNTLTITVTAVNDAPTVTFAQTTVTVLEDAGAQSLSSFATFSPGPANESAQTLVGCTVSVDNAALFIAGPVVANNGTLTFTPAANANGSATVTVVVQDNGGTTDGGVDKSTNAFTINVTPVNDAPSVTFAQGVVTVLEDAGAQSLSSFATFSPGPANESAQTLVGYTVTVDNTALFSSLPAVNNSGVLTFTSSPDANGSATVTVVVQDSGGTGLAPTGLRPQQNLPSGGVDKSTNTFTIIVTPVNDAPSVTFAQTTVTVLEDAGAQSLGSFATFSPGPANEAAQTLVGYTVSVDNAALFSAAPVVANNGTFTFTPAANANGSATVTVVVQDSGGTTDSGVDKSTNTFTINVTPVNDAPSVTFAQSVVTVVEDAGAQTVAGFATFSPGPANESVQALVGYTVIVDNAALFSVAPAINNAGVLTFTPGANANGSATVTVVAQDSGGAVGGGVDKSTNSFTITVTPVNDAPSVTFAQSVVTVLEDAGAQSLATFATFSAGPASELAQTLVGYTVTVDNAALFSAAPAVANNGTLSFTPAANANGSATVTVIVQDNGGTTDGGVDKSTNTFTINVTPVNDAPSVTFVRSSVTVLEDAGAQTMAGFATFSPGPANESAQTLVGYTVTVDNPALFTMLPAINNSGVLTFTPAPDANGSATVTVIVQDSGGAGLQPGGLKLPPLTTGVDKSTNTFIINVTAVNDAPSVAFAQGVVTVLEDAGAQSLNGFAVFSSGPVNESAQSLTGAGFQVANNNASLFSVPPALASDGTLAFTPAANANGSALVTVIVQDSGGTANGGVDKATNSFTITVTAVNDAPSVTFAQSVVTLLEDAGAQSLASFAAFSPGPANESAQTLVGYTVTMDNAALFLVAPAIDNNGRLTFTPATNANGSATVTVVVQDSGGAGPGVDQSTNTFTISVTPVNDAPSVSFAQSVVTVLEDAVAQSLTGFATFSPGPPNESAQSLVGYTVTVDNATLFSVAPAINNAGVLTFTPASDANGSATMSVVVQDSGGTANGGLDKSTNTFTISVTPVNDAPSVTFAQSVVTVLEDAGAQSLTGFAAFSSGPANESAQTLVGYTITVDNAALFSAAPAINNAGLLTFTSAPDANGTATVTVVVQDSGGTGSAPTGLRPQLASFGLGVDRSTNTFTIIVTPVNDAPSVTFSRSLVAVQESVGPQSLAGFATFSPGPANESAQTLVGYTVTVDNASLFSAAPAIDNAGRLTFTSAVNSNGLANVMVVVQDNGGTGSLGVDKSTNTFVITVGAVNNAPVANHDSYSMNQGDVLTVVGLMPVGVGPTPAGVLANDTDVESDALSATKLTDPGNGTVVLSANGGFTYTPDTNFFGTDTFTYRASDYCSNSNPATVSILVLARPTNAVPLLQRVFSSTVLRFSATNTPDANPIRVGDPDSTLLTVTLAVTNGTLDLTVTNGLDLPNGFTGTNALVLSGTIADLNAALESLAYRSTTNYFGDDALVIVSTDEGGRTNRGHGLVPILVEIPTLGGVPKVSLENLNDPMTGRMITNVTMVASDTNLVKEITFNPTNSEVNVLAVGGQDGSTNRSTITVRVKFNDGTEQDVTIPVIIYQPLLTSVNGDAAYTSTFGTPIFNPQTSLYEQKVSVVNNTPFDFTALRITATNLPAGVTLRNASITNGGLPYIEYNLAVRSGSNVTLTLEYYNVNRASGITPGLKLELLNQTRVVPPPSNPVMVAVTGRRGYAPDGRIRFYIEFPTEVGLTYYVQYQDAVGDPWKTSPVIIPGTGNRLNWLDDGAPNTDSPPTATRFYRIVTGQ